MRNSMYGGGYPATTAAIGFRMDSLRRREEEDMMERQRRKQVQADNAQAFSDAHQGNGFNANRGFSASGDGRFNYTQTNPSTGAQTSWDSMAGDSAFIDNQTFSNRIRNAGRAVDQDAKQKQRVKDQALATILEQSHANDGFLPPSMLNELNSIVGDGKTKIIGGHFVKNGDYLLYGEQGNGVRGPMMILNKDQQLSLLGRMPGIGTQLGQQIYNDKIKSGLSPESIYSSTGYKLLAAMDRNQVMREKNEANAAIQREKIQASRDAAEAKNSVGGRAPSERDFDYARDDFERLNGIIANKDGSYTPEQISSAKEELAWKREAWDARVYGKRPDKITAEQRAAASKALDDRRNAKAAEEQKAAQQKAAFDRAFSGGKHNNAAYHSDGTMTFLDDNGVPRNAKPGAIIDFGGKEYRWKGGGIGVETFEPVETDAGGAANDGDSPVKAEDQPAKKTDENVAQKVYPNGPRKGQPVKAERIDTEPSQESAERKNIPGMKQDAKPKNGRKYDKRAYEMVRRWKALDGSPRYSEYDAKYDEELQAAQRQLDDADRDARAKAEVDDFEQYELEQTKIGQAELEARRRKVVEDAIENGRRIAQRGLDAKREREANEFVRQLNDNVREGFRAGNANRARAKQADAIRMESMVGRDRQLMDDARDRADMIERAQEPIRERHANDRARAEEITNDMLDSHRRMKTMDEIRRKMDESVRAGIADKDLKAEMEKEDRRIRDIISNGSQDEIDKLYNELDFWKDFYDNYVEAKR